MGELQERVAVVVFVEPVQVPSAVTPPTLSLNALQTRSAFASVPEIVIVTVEPGVPLNKKATMIHLLVAYWKALEPPAFELVYGVPSDIERPVTVEPEFQVEPLQTTFVPANGVTFQVQLTDEATVPPRVFAQLLGKKERGVIGLAEVAAPITEMPSVAYDVTTVLANATEVVPVTAVWNCSSMLLQKLALLTSRSADKVPDCVECPASP